MIGSRIVRRLCRLLLVVVAMATWPAAAQGATLRGHVVSGARALPGYFVVLYATDPARPLECADVVAGAATRRDGSFELSYTPPADGDAVLYVIAQSGSVRRGKTSPPDRCRAFAGSIVLAAVLGPAGTVATATDVVVNERTTVAAAFALAQFIDGSRIAGKAPGLQNAAGNVWVANFGFHSPACADPPPANSVSKFGPDGTALSPGVTGYTQGAIDWPQGAVSDEQGNIWSCGNGVVTKYPGGDPAAAQQFVADPACGTASECARPLDIAFNHRGWAFVTLNEKSSVAILRSDGTPIRHSPITGVFDRPLAIAADSRGNMWVANSASLRIPCPSGFLDPRGTNGSITMIRRDGRATKGPFRGGGVTIAWGIAVDGDDNVWVANFDGQRLSHSCGRDPRRCPPGATTGSPISPDTGYAFDGLTRNTAVEIDPSGNVWVTNNWKNQPNPVGNPGGYEMVVFAGVASPIATPLIGPPRRP